MSSDPQIDEILKSLQALSPLEREIIMKQLIDGRKEVNKEVSKEVIEERPPTYADIVSGVRIPRPVTPADTKNTSKHILNSPQTPYQGGSRKVWNIYIKLILFRSLELRKGWNLKSSILYLMKKWKGINPLSRYLRIYWMMNHLMIFQISVKQGTERSFLHPLLKLKRKLKWVIQYLWFY
jgi:hypothetical protein